MSKNTLKYRGYLAIIEYSAEDHCLYGKIEGISDLVTFESDSTLGIEEEFHAAVDDYLAFCAETGKTPCRTYSGSFNVRIKPETHHDLDYYAIEHQMTLNAVVSKACEQFRTAVSNGTQWVSNRNYIPIDINKTSIPINQCHGLDSAA